MDLWLGALTALWLGLITSISPCPLASNIAATAFVAHRLGNKKTVLLSGVLYAIGRSLSYLIIGAIIAVALIDTPGLSDFLHKYINKFLGPLLILLGMLLLDLLPISLPSISFSEDTVKKLDKFGLIGSLFLGMLFALAFCPISGGLFFGSLVPLTVKVKSYVLVPFLYGIGSAIPVLIFAILAFFGSALVGRFYEKVTRVERYVRLVTGAVLLLIGLYYVLKYIFGLI